MLADIVVSLDEEILEAVVALARVPVGIPIPNKAGGFFGVPLAVAEEKLIEMITTVRTGDHGSESV